MPSPLLLRRPQTVMSQSSVQAQPTWLTLPAEVQHMTTQLLAHLLKQVQVAGRPGGNAQEVPNDD
jgi:hypothetical protein